MRGAPHAACAETSLDLLGHAPFYEWVGKRRALTPRWRASLSARFAGLRSKLTESQKYSSVACAAGKSLGGWLLIFFETSSSPVEKL